MANEPKSKERFVRYVGTSDVREITGAQWSNVGAKDQNKTVWSVRNGWKLPVSDFSDNALQYFEKDSGFVVDSGEE